MKSIGVLIGRFAPLHNGHLELIKYGEANFDEFLVIVGSAEQSPRLSNPFSIEQRIAITQYVTGAHIGTSSDYPYDNNKWAAKTKKLINHFGVPSKDITLISGNDEWYFKLFPEYKTKIVKTTNPNIHATNIRNWWYRNEMVSVFRPFVPKVSEDAMIFHPRRRELMEEYQSCELQKTKFPGIAVTTDAMVTHQDKILLVTRGKYPGKGQLALPGGFLEEREWLEENMFKELEEETGLNLRHRKILNKKVFDWPSRSSRNRTVTQCFWLTADDAHSVTGEDDAAHAAWYDINTLNPVQMFEDHYHIIQEMRK